MEEKLIVEKFGEAVADEKSFAKAMAYADAATRLWGLATHYCPHPQGDLPLVLGRMKHILNALHAEESSAGSKVVKYYLELKRIEKEIKGESLSETDSDNTE